MVPSARIAHNIKGRMRIKVPPMKGSEDYFSHLARELSGIPGIIGVETNPSTASVLVLHETEPEKIIGYANENGLFRVLDPGNNNNGAAGRPIRLTSRIAGVFKRTDSKMLDISGGQIDMGGVAFLTLAGLGIYQIYRGNFMAPAWYTAFWYAFVILKSAALEKEPALVVG